MDKQLALRELETEIIKNDSLPLRESRLVFGEGNPNAAVMFIGEAPGFHEDQQGRPFVGRGGKLLDEVIASIGWKREKVYITNIVKRRPPENRDPLPDEIEAYKPYLTKQIEIIGPKIIVPLGRFATNYFLPLAKITRDQGIAFKVGGRVVVPMLHPAAALRGTGAMNQFRESFKKLPGILEGVLSGTFTPAVVEAIGPAHPEKKKHPQSKLFL
ncbi:MAG: uracil-DNA glycosylase [Patescibacteria group bacterium]